MLKNTRKSNPKPSKYQQHNSRSFLIRDIIGDRSFNNHSNSHQNEGIKKVKFSDGEDGDISKLGRTVMSDRCEATEDPRRKGCLGDFAAKTSEYAFFKRFKNSTCGNVRVRPDCHDSQPNDVGQSDKYTREEAPNVQKESTKYGGSSLPVEKEGNDGHYSFLSPQCRGSKDTDINNEFGAVTPIAQYARSGEDNWLSPSVGSKTKTSGNDNVFSVKRERLRHMIADQSLYDFNEGSSKGFDLVSALISRIIPENQGNNSLRETDSKCKIPFSELEAATLINGHRAYKRKSESRHISYLDDGFSRSTKRLVDMDLLEWNPMGSESSFTDNYCHKNTYKRKTIQSPHIAYLDGPLSRYESSFQYSYGRAQGDFRIPNFDVESVLSLDEPLPRYDSHNFQYLEESHFHNEPKLLEPPLSRTLLLGWEDSSEKDEFQFSTSSTSQDDSQLFMPNALLKEEHFLVSSSLPYTPKRLMVVEDCRISFSPQDYNWSMNESYKEKEHHDSESLLSMIRSPANNLLRLPNTVLHSFAVKDEHEEEFLYSSDQFLEGKSYGSSSYIEPFHDFDHIEYPLLLRDSSWNDEL